MESPYNLLFGKNPALRSLFDDYFEGPNRFTTRMVMLKLDSFSDFIFTVGGPLDQNSEEGIVGNAEFRLESVSASGEAILDICVSNAQPTLQILVGSRAEFPGLGVGAFCRITPFFNKEISYPGEDRVFGFTCRSGNVFAGSTFCAPHTRHRRFFPQTAWLVSKMGVLNAGVQYESKFRSKDKEPNETLENWSFAISYGRDRISPLTPSFNFGLQFANNSQFIASFYRRMVVQSRVKNPFETNEVVRITNYIDFGFELQKRMSKYSNKIRDSTFQVVGSWQANKNLLVKGKVGPQSSSIALVFKSWWKSALTFNILAVRDRTKRETSFGFGFQIDNNRQPRHQMAHPNFVMHTTNMEHSVVSNQRV